MSSRRFLPGLDVALAVVAGICAVLSIFIALCMFVLPFLTIDRNFTIQPGISFDNVASAWDPLMIEAIGNSVMLSMIASLFAIACGAAVTRMLRRFPWVVGIGLALVYTVNPVTRAFSFADFFTIQTPLSRWASLMIGEWSAQMILLPAFILGAHYLPVYLMRFLFVIRKDIVSHRVTGLLDTLFVSFPAFLRGFPISFALFFLLTFFDYWVIQVISGGKALYWSQMFEQKAFVARDLGQAGMLIILGLLMTVVAYLAALIVCSAVRSCWKYLRPLRVAAICLPQARFLGSGLGWIVLLFLSWPLFYSIIRLSAILLRGGSLALMDGAGRSILLTFILASLIAAASTLISFLLSAFFREYPRRYGWWLPGLYFLALVPEAAYVLFSLCVTGSGLLRASPGWLFFLMVSFSAPMSFFLWESLWGESEERKLWILSGAMRGDIARVLPMALREWRRYMALTFMVNIWMTVDNVFITNFAAGPKWKPVSAVLFTATKRGFQDAEFLTGMLGSLVIVVVVVGVLLLSGKNRLRISH